MYNYGWFAQPPPEVNLKLGLTNRYYQRLYVPLHLCFLLPKRLRICYNQKVNCVNTVGDEFELETLQHHLFSFSVKASEKTVNQKNRWKTSNEDLHRGK